MPIDVAHSPTGKVVVVRLSGEQDLSTAPDLREVLYEACQAAELVVLDLTACTFLDSTALGVCAGAYKRLGMRGASLIGLNATGTVRRVLAITGMDQLLQMSHDLEHDNPELQALLTADGHVVLGPSVTAVE